METVLNAQTQLEMLNWTESFLMEKGLEGCLIETFVEASMEKAKEAQYDFERFIHRDLEKMQNESQIVVLEENIKWNYM